MYTAYLHEIVGRGAEMLDRQIPGWEDQINVERLRMNSPTDCVIGQLLGNYHRTNHILAEREGCDAHGRYQFNTAHGFELTIHSFGLLPYASISTNEVVQRVTSMYDALTAHWKREITQRREARFVKQLREKVTADERTHVEREYHPYSRLAELSEELDRRCCTVRTHHDDPTHVRAFRGWDLPVVNRSLGVVVNSVS